MKYYKIDFIIVRSSKVFKCFILARLDLIVWAATALH